MGLTVNQNNSIIGTVQMHRYLDKPYKDCGLSKQDKILFILFFWHVHTEGNLWSAVNQTFDFQTNLS